MGDPPGLVHPGGHRTHDVKPVVAFEKVFMSHLVQKVEPYSEV